MTSPSAVSGYWSRPLGYGEQLWLRLSEAASNNALMIVFLEGRLDPLRLERALGYAVSAFPILRARAVTAAGRSEMVSSDPIGLPWTVTPRASDQHWQRIGESETNIGINPDEPLLWRARLVHGPEQSELLLTFNHAISDGQSLQLLADAILRCYEADGDVLERMEPAESYEAHMAVPGPAAAVLKAIPRVIRDIAARRPPVMSLPENVWDSGQPLQTRYVSISLDAHQSGQLLKASKARGESLHGLVGSLFLLAAQDSLAPTGPPATINMSTAINVRSRIKGNFDQELGYFAGAFESRFAVASATGVWDLARQVNADARAKFTAEAIALSVLKKRLILAVKKTGKSLVDAAARHSRTALHFTNLGRIFVQPAYGGLEVTRVMLMPSVNFMKKPVLCLECHYFREQLHLTFSYPDPVTDPGFVKAMIDCLQSRVEEIAGGNGGPSSSVE